VESSLETRGLPIYAGSTMLERYIHIGADVLYVRHNRLLPGRPTILFLHGLGDSSLSYEYAFSSEPLAAANLLATDLAGYGRSSASADYSFAAHARRLRGLLEALAPETSAAAPGAKSEANGVCLVAHSMGAIPAILLCRDDRAGIVRKLMLVEGSITQYGAFISSSAHDAHQQNNFEQWYEHDFLREYILKQYLERFPHCGSYYASLRFCRKAAFLQNVLEMRKLHLEFDGKWKSRVGKLYAELSLPKVYCYGDGGMGRETLQFLTEHGLETKVLRSTCHFLMLDRRREFYQFVREFCCKVS